MKTLLLASLLLLTACGAQLQSTQDPRAFSSTDPTFQPYINKYITYKGSALSYDIPIQFTDLPRYTVGLCTRWSNGYRQIQIDTGYWDQLDEGARQEVITHELGHCDLNLNHTPSENPQTHIMDPYVFSFNNYTSAQITSMLNDLFNRATMPTVSSKTEDSDCVRDISVE